MRKLLLILPFILLSALNSLYSQVIKYRAKQFSIQEIDSPEKRTWNECNFLVVIDTVDSKIALYKSKAEKYDIVKFFKDKEDEISYTSAFKAVDENGKEFTMSLSTVVGKKYYDALLIILYKGFTVFYKMQHED